MKRLIPTIAFLILIINVRAQLVERYENPQRFQFSAFSNHENMQLPTIHCDEDAERNVYFSHRYSFGTQRTIYGIAIPIFTRDHLSSGYGTPAERWNNLINYFDTSGCSVILGTTTQTSGYEYELLSTAHIRIGENALIGNYFKMPDSDSTRLMANHNSTFFPVIEVYFDQPKYVNRNYIVGCNIIPHQITNHNNPITPITNLFCNVLTITNVGTVTETATYSTLVNDSLINTSQGVEHYSVIDENSWGGPFPIITPPPCMPPIKLDVKKQYRNGATITWKAQYGTTDFEVEYGPQGFLEGTGIISSAVTSGANYMWNVSLDSLEMDADYTVRVRTYCENNGGYSDWNEVNFHTNNFYLVTTSVNNDSCGYIEGGGWHLADTTIRLFAYGINDSPFQNWSDGSTQNPRIVTLTRDTAFHAIFQCNSGGNAEDFESLCDNPTPISIFPNPTDGITTIHCNKPITSWTVYNMQGIALFYGKPNSETVRIDLSDLPPAVYILKTYTEQKSETMKIVVK